MKSFAKNAGKMLLCLFELFVGILLLIDPVGFTTAIVMIFGAFAAVGGLAWIFKYFRSEIAVAVTEQNLFKGLFALLIGAFCLLNAGWFTKTFPILTVIYGISVLVAGLVKVQWCVNFLRLNHKKWYMHAISGAVSILCAVLILSNPFKTVDVLWHFIGITLILEAFVDIVSILMSGVNKVNTPTSEVTDLEVCAETTEVVDEN